MAFVAKDAKGFQKSLGGDIFTASWARAGDDEPATHGTAPSHNPLMDILQCSMHSLSHRQCSAARCWQDEWGERLSCIILDGEMGQLSPFILHKESLGLS